MNTNEMINLAYMGIYYKETLNFKQYVEKYHEQYADRLIEIYNILLDR